MPDKIRCRVVLWEEIEHWAEDVADKIRKSGYVPDVVIGLTRGGWIPARILCDNLVCKNLFSIKVEHWGITAQTDMKAKLVQELNLDVRGKRVLLVDDITDTGESLALSIDHIKAKKPKDIRTATLMHITHSKIVPDYYSVEVPKEEWRWFIFPWNFKEDVENLVGKLGKGFDDPRKLADMMQKEYELEKSQKILDTIVKHLAQRRGKNEERPPVKKRKR
jgi:hypoxanthine phosphoribosyltransferase